jgi:hypothetical protein
MLAVISKSGNESKNRREKIKEKKKKKKRQTTGVLSVALYWTRKSPNVINC